ncbi:RtcB family protein [Bradyrhizobium hipponense]|nr:RtcB family protein [Bradyrhizobium hipponense]
MENAMRAISPADLKQTGPCTWDIPRSFRNDMRATARLFADQPMLDHLFGERALEQLVNMTTLPGVQEPALAMPDIHQGYGFPIGGVAAIRADEGVISPGGVGYDINCGVRLLASEVSHGEIRDRLPALATQIQRDVPTGVGRAGRITLDEHAMDLVLNTGLRWAIGAGHGDEADAEVVEERGCLAAANANTVPDRAKKRGADQLGTLGAGNHFLELQRVERIYDQECGRAFGLFEGQVTVLIHTGSRGLGHQTCTEYVRRMDVTMANYGITLPDRELSCAPFHSPEGQDYFHAMAAAANFAWCNRQVITHEVRDAWKRVLGSNQPLAIVYDVSHNIAKLEEHRGVPCIVHRKGATRAFGPGHPELPERYRTTGQPVFIPGSMGTASYVLAGTETAMRESFGSACHGAGRELSRHKAKKTISYDQLRASLRLAGIEVRAGSARGLIEEAPEAYKAVDEVVDVTAQIGIARKVARLRPIAIIKG